MDCRCNKNYNAHNCKSRKQVETYFSQHLNLGLARDILLFPTQYLLQAADQGLIKGDSIIEAACGSFLHLAGSLHNKFEKIYLLRFSEDCVKEVKNWLNNVPGAYDWSKTGSMIGDLINYKKPIGAVESQFKSVVKCVLKCDMKNHNIADPVELSLADCVLVAGVVEMVCQNEEEFYRYIGKFQHMVKPGGQFIYCGVLGASYFQVDGVRHPIFSSNENMVINAITKQGFTIIQSKIHKSTNTCDLMDHKSIFIAIARKQAY